MSHDLQKKFVAVILTHKRPNKVLTFQALRTHGYRGEIRLLVDDGDPTLEEYRKNFGELVWVFSKQKMKGEFDAGDNFGNTCSITYPRNAAFDAVKADGFTHFVELDDDYRAFAWRFDSNLRYKYHPVRSLSKIFEAMVEFIDKAGAKSIAMAQGGDFIGGELGSFAKDISLRRKCMNSFVCNVERRIRFKGTINEDVNAYVGDGNIGDLFFTTNVMSLQQEKTQSNAGGLTDLYLASGTYVKSFYSVMYRPSAVRIGVMGNSDKRIHHKISWRNAVPKIVRESVRKI